MAMYKFTLTGKRAGQTVTLMDKYVFVDGELIVTGKVARAVKPILVDFYACTMAQVTEQANDEPQAPVVEQQEPLSEEPGPNDDGPPDAN